MHFYVIDPSGVDDKTFVKLQSELLSTLTELHIPGEYARTTPLRSVHSLIEQARNLEAKTIVAVGNDETLQEVVTATAGSNVAIGYIPFRPTALSRTLGVSEDFRDACHTIAARRIIELDTGKLNGNLFLSSVALGNRTALELPSRGWLQNFRNIRALWNYAPARVRMRIDGHFDVELEILLGLIMNTRTVICPKAGDHVIGNPHDGILDVLLVPRMSVFAMLKARHALLSDCYENIPGVSLFRAKRIELMAPENYPLIMDGKIISKAPTTISLAPKKLKMIVGKHRQF
jgi:diacylglycerol kinase family enzyme